MKKTPTDVDPHAELEAMNAAAIARVPRDERATSSEEDAIAASREAAVAGEKTRLQRIANRRKRKPRDAEITSQDGDNA